MAWERLDWSFMLVEAVVLGVVVKGVVEEGKYGIDHQRWGNISVFKVTRRYGSLRGPTSSTCGGLRPSAEDFFALWAKKKLFLLFGPFLAIFGAQ